MNTLKKDLYFYFNNSDAYKYDVALLCLNRRRGYMHMPCADLIAIAYDEFDQTYPENFLMLDAENRACRFFVENYNITFREDIIYLINHPEYVKEPDRNPEVTYKKIRFNIADKLQANAYEWLNEFKPRERIDEALKVVRQYLIKSQDEYFIEQMALQKIMNLREMNRTSEVLLDDTKHVVDVIWSIGGYGGKEKK